MDALVFAGGFPLAAFLLSACAWTSYLVARHLLPEAQTSARLAGTAVVALSLLIGGFWPLALLHAFRLPIVVPLWALGATVAHRRLDGSGAARQLAADLRRCAAVFRDLGLWRWGLLLVLMAPLAKLLRGLAFPPLAWDSLTYHLLHPGRWIQYGGFATQHAPDAWGFYEYFPIGGEVIWAWAMLPVSGDALVALAGILVWCTLLLGVYAAARALDLPERRSLLAALFAGTVPAILTQATSGYVDNTTAALFSLGSVFLIRALRSGAPVDRILAVAALAVNASTKHFALPLAVLGVGVLAAATLARVRPWRAALLQSMALVLIPLLLGGYPYLRAWVETGSPLYPASLELFGRTIFPGNREFELLVGGTLFPGASPGSRWLLQTMFHGSVGPSWPHMNLGLGMIPVLGLSAGGLVALGRVRGLRLAGAVLAGVAVLNLKLVLSDQLVALRQVWWWVSGRYLCVAVVCVTLLAAAYRGRGADWLWGIAVLLSMTAITPMGFGALGVWGAVAVAFGLAVALSIGVPTARFLLRRGVRWAGLAAGVVAMAGFGMQLQDLRAALRRPAEQAAARLEEFEIHPLDVRFADAWPVWRYFDSGKPHRIAVTAGWDGFGHNWFQYPLLGSHLQNVLVYVPVARDGSVIDYRLAHDLALAADYDAWRERLLRENIDHVVVLPPLNVPEMEWMRTHPAEFEPIAFGISGNGAAFRIVRPEST